MAFFQLPGDISSVTIRQYFLFYRTRNNFHTKNTWRTFHCCNETLLYVDETKLEIFLFKCLMLSFPCKNLYIKKICMHDAVSLQFSYLLDSHDRVMFDSLFITRMKRFVCIKRRVR